jgi:hypothetical protein
MQLRAASTSAGTDPTCCCCGGGEGARPICRRPPSSTSRADAGRIVRRCAAHLGSDARALRRAKLAVARCGSICRKKPPWRRRWRRARVRGGASGCLRGSRCCCGWRGPPTAAARSGAAWEKGDPWEGRAVRSIPWGERMSRLGSFVFFSYSIFFFCLEFGCPRRRVEIVIVRGAVSHF